jgi:hypothetical protein
LTSIQHLSIFIKIHRNGANIEIVAVWPRCSRTMKCL